ncbi:putative nucleic acid-binding protein, contains PIN domain [Halovivax ruber XH-70]|uniref:Putative nucleic acid-binding protein, contains PIN domain n=1 Tax=Halovivax ruber (strain DSM 18193 / JCM 13892 / XH-70) TaxID=797302 RepID=L0ICB2_HALRX|nr:PIN domain-containing protein [Halovivax ruber]AGB17210.1 putative nucleic acid-binding protein, contains PIN domain [Halovivax ruber XH-70]
MSVFIDTGVFFAQHDEAAPRHPKATEAMSSVLGGTFGQPYTSDYVIDETITLTRKRSGSYEAALTAGQRILGLEGYPDHIQTIQITTELFEHSLKTFRQYSDHELSFTDACTIAVVEKYDIDSVLSFDDDFDGIVERIDPSTV